MTAAITATASGGPTKYRRAGRLAPTSARVGPEVDADQVSQRSRPDHPDVEHGAHRAPRAVRRYHPGGLNSHLPAACAVDDGRRHQRGLTAACIIASGGVRMRIGLRGSSPTRCPRLPYVSEPHRTAVTADENVVDVFDHGAISSWLAIPGRAGERLRRRAAPRTPRRGRAGPARNRLHRRVHA